MKTSVLLDKAIKLLSKYKKGKAITKLSEVKELKAIMEELDSLRFEYLRKEKETKGKWNNE